MSLAQLGWSDHWHDQISEDEAGLLPARLTGIHRAHVRAITADGPGKFTLMPHETTGDLAVGDWVLIDPETDRVARRLDRRSCLQRGAAHDTGLRQLIAANIDTLFITTSCNADFNVARLERYLALAHDAGIAPVILLTKADLCDTPADYATQAQALGADLAVLTLDARTEDAVAQLAPWCGPGQSIALAGSSGVGKTTLVNALTGETGATQGIREDDARGRHTTTSRSLHLLPTGGVLIDTPGMRGLGVADVAAGIAATFPEITALIGQCKYRDCLHGIEPGCAVQAAVAAGEIDAARVERWRKLQVEDQVNQASIEKAQARIRKAQGGGKAAKRARARSTRE